MDPVADALLTELAAISASLIGLFLVGMILYIQTGFGRAERTRDVVEPYFRAATMITFISLALPLGVSLTLVTLPIGWSRLLYGALILGLVAADLKTIDTVRACAKATGLNLLWAMEAVGTVLVLAMAVTPLWIGGLTPRREDLVPGLLLGLAVGFLSTCVLVLTLFDIARIERSEMPVQEQ